MADIPEVISSDPVELLGIGRRHLAVRDYSSAVNYLGKACEVLAQKHGQQADQCGEAYLWYGKALLGLAREESGVLGDGIPQGGEESQEDDEGAEDENDDVEMNGEEETKKTDESEKAVEESEKATEQSEKVAEESKKATVESSDKMETNEETESKEKQSKTKDEEMPSSSSNAEPTASTSDEGPDGLDESKNGDEDEEGDEDEVENLQVAWEVLELARDIFLKRGDIGKRELADVYLHLGEVSLESETYDKAIIDMGKSLEIMKDLYTSDDRRIAETHYQIGLAHSLSNGFDDAVNHFKTAASILEARIKALESPTVKTDDANVKKYLASDPFYTVDGEIKELKELLPEIQEKIQDMLDYKSEAIKSVKESLGISTNGESSSSKTNGSSSKPEPEKKASDISHLVKRKRKPSDGTDETSAAKKQAP